MILEFVIKGFPSKNVDVYFRSSLVNHTIVESALVDVTKVKQKGESFLEIKPVLGIMSICVFLHVYILGMLS